MLEKNIPFNDWFCDPEQEQEDGWMVMNRVFGCLFLYISPCFLSQRDSFAVVVIVVAVVVVVTALPQVTTDQKIQIK